MTSKMKASSKTQIFQSTQIALKKSMLRTLTKPFWLTSMVPSKVSKLVSTKVLVSTLEPLLVNFVKSQHRLSNETMINQDLHSKRFLIILKKLNINEYFKIK
jgi:hypothetical protein